MPIIRLIREREITALYHFTTTINLLGMFSIGRICPRSEYDTLRNLADENLYGDYLDHMDELRLDGLNNYVNTSLSHPNVYLLQAYKSRKDLAHYSWCILRLDPHLMERPETLFSMTNAASASAAEYGIRDGVDGFNQLFSDEVITRKGQFTRRGLPPEYPTDIQAEVLIPGAIDLDTVKAVYFETASDLHGCASAFKLMGHADAVELFSVNEAVFSTRRS